MNIPPPVEHTAYQRHLEHIADAAQVAAKESCVTAAKEAEESMEFKNIQVSVDGSWQKRGFSSKNGIVTVLTVMGKHKGSKVLDTEVVSTYCHSSAQMTSLEVRNYIQA